MLMLALIISTPVLLALSTADALVESVSVDELNDMGVVKRS